MISLRWASAASTRSALGEHAGTRGVELDGLTHGIGQRCGQHQPPMRQPVIKKLLEKLCATSRRSSGWAMSRKLGAQPWGWALYNKGFRTPRPPKIHVPDATAVRQDLLLLFARQRPARGIVGRIHDQQPRALGDGLEQPRQSPAPRHRPAAAVARSAPAPHDGGLRHQIGPYGVMITASSQHPPAPARPA